MLIVWWLLEQGVWVGPPAAVLLYLAIPRRSRPAWGPATVSALVVVFGLNLFGLYLDEPRVSCTFAGGPPVCTNRITVSARQPHAQRALAPPLRSHEMVAPTSRPGVPSRSVGVEVELPHPMGWVNGDAATSTPPYVGPPMGIGRPTQVGAAASGPAPALTPAGAPPPQDEPPAGAPTRIRTAGMERGPVGVEHRTLGPAWAAAGLHRGCPAAALACGGAR